jgi:hypothetical protein
MDEPFKFSIRSWRGVTYLVALSSMLWPEHGHSQVPSGFETVCESPTQRRHSASRRPRDCSSVIAPSAFGKTPLVIPIGRKAEAGRPIAQLLVADRIPSDGRERRPDKCGSPRPSRAQPNDEVLPRSTATPTPVVHTPNFAPLVLCH